MCNNFHNSALGMFFLCQFSYHWRSIFEHFPVLLTLVKGWKLETFSIGAVQFMSYGNVRILHCSKIV